MLEVLLDILFPKKCVHCKRYGEYLCPDCLGEVEFLSEQFCPACKEKSVLGYASHGCSKRTSLDQLYSICWYRGPIRSLLNQFKFGNTVRDLETVLRDLITRALMAEDLADWSKLKIIPVPMLSSRERQRGFNQSELIGRILSEVLTASLLTDVLIKTKDTPKQSTLNRQERRRNIQGSFAVQVKSTIGSDFSVLLIDDVYTTGSTMQECAKILKKELGVKKVVGFSFARG